MNEDIAGEKYWELVWAKQKVISKIDTNYYTNKLLHELYVQYFDKDSNKSILEVGCALSQNLLYFSDEFNYKINGIDYEKNAAVKTQEIYKEMGYNANISYRDFFDDSEFEKFDVVSSFGVFEHFDNLPQSIGQTKKYLKDNGMILTFIPNMNGIVGFLSKLLNKKVYDIHIPYTKNDIIFAHESAGYETLFCDYYGGYQGGVINVSGIKMETFIGKLLALPGKPIYYLNLLLNLNINGKIISPYTIYIGKLNH